MAIDAWLPAPGYLNASTLGLPPRRTADALRDALDAWQGGRACAVGYDEHVQASRALYARLVGVPAGWVAVGSQASVMTAEVAVALPDGALVLTVAGEFTSVTGPFELQQRRGVRTVGVPLDGLADAVRAQRPAVVAFSLAQSADGRLADLDAVEAAAREVGALTLCDTTQAAGWAEVEAARWDVTVCSAYKWLCAPRGSAFLTVRPEALDRLSGHNAGWYAGADVWASVYGPGLQVAADARQFDVSPAWLSWVGTRTSLEVLLGLPAAVRRSHGADLADTLRERLGLAPEGRPVLCLPDPDGGVLAALSAAGCTAVSRPAGPGWRSTCGTTTRTSTAWSTPSPGCGRSSHPPEDRRHLAEQGGVVARDGRVRRVVRHEPDVAVAAPVRLDGGLAVDHGRDDLAVLRHRLLPDDDPVAVADGRVDHRVADHLQQEQGAVADHLPGEREDVLHDLLREQRAARRDPAHERHHARLGHPHLVVAVAGAEGRRGAGAAGRLVVRDGLRRDRRGRPGAPAVVRVHDLDGRGPVGVAAQVALALERGQLVRHAAGRGQPDELADLPHGRRVAAGLHRLPDGVQDEALPRREAVEVGAGHRGFSFARAGRPGGPGGCVRPPVLSSDHEVRASNTCPQAPARACPDIPAPLAAGLRPAVIDRRSNTCSTKSRPEVNVQAFDSAGPASNTRPEEHTMSTATLTSVRLTAAARPVRPRRLRRRVDARPRARSGGRPAVRAAGGTRTAAAPRPGLVLTTRGRRLLRALVLSTVTVVLAVALVLAWVTVAASVAPGASAGAGAAGVASGAGAGEVRRSVAVVVAPGDTLWQLAREHAPDRDPRSVVADIVELNDLGSTGVQAGTEVLVPVD